MATKPRTSKAAAAAPEAAAPAAIVSTAEGVESIHAAILASVKAGDTQASADKAAKSLADRTRFEHTIDNMVAVGERICQGYAPILGYDPMTVSGSVIYAQVKTDPDSLIYDADSDRRSKSGSKSHWDRCATMWQRDSETLRAKFLAAKTMASNKDIYALWLAVMLGFKTLEDCSPDSSVTVAEDGTITAAVVKGPRQTQEQIDKAAKTAADKARKVLGLSESATLPTANTAATLPALLATLATADAAGIDAICEQYAARLSSIAPEMWESMALAFGAGVIQRERIAAAAADPEAAALAALAAAV